MNAETNKRENSVMQSAESASHVDVLIIFIKCIVIWCALHSQYDYYYFAWCDVRFRKNDVINSTAYQRLAANKLPLNRNYENVSNANRLALKVRIYLCVVISDGGSDDDDR